MNGSRLANGSRVAIIGGGIAGAGLAASLLFNGRARGSTLDVRVYESSEPGTLAPPAVLTPECRSRLAALGCRVPPEWRAHELRGVEIISHGHREVMPSAPGGLWVVDGWPQGQGGLALVREVLAGAATSQGARFISRHVERVENQPPAPDAPAAVRKSGPLIVRAQGSGDRFHAVALATGAGPSLGDNFFPGFNPAPTVPAVQARLRHATPRLSVSPLARLWLSPLPTVDGLLLLPGAHSVYALAFGPSVTPADLCQVLMMAARDGLVEFSGQLRTIAVGLTKICNDLRWMGSGPRTGLAEIALPDLQPGSSIMPGKVNPVLPEATLMVCAQVIGNDACVAWAGASGSFELNVMMPVMARNVLESIRLLSTSSRLLADRCVVGIEPDVERARELAESSPSIVTPLNRLIGYENAAKVAKQSVAERRTIREVVLEHGYVDRGELTEAQLDEALDVLAMTRPPQAG